MELFCRLTVESPYNPKPTRGFIAEARKSGEILWASIFHGHHDPYHFAGLTHYQLRKVLPDKWVGSVLGQTTKASRYQSDHRRVSTDVGEQSYSCSGEVPGSSVGWSDTYAASLFGQSVSIAGIPPGEYWVVVVASSVFAEKE